MSKPIYVLGTHDSHDGSACLLKDGKICAAIEKERITGRKHDGFNDTDAILYCLEKENISFSDLDLIVQNSQGGSFPEQRLITEDCPVPVVTISHHLAHAYSAIGTCHFSESAVLVIDGSGNTLDKCTDMPDTEVPFINKIPQDRYAEYREVDSSYYFDGKNCTLICKRASLMSPDFKYHTEESIGDLYAGASRYCFGSLFDAGKLMGLAPYGDPSVYQGEIFVLKDGMVYVDKSQLEQFKDPSLSFEQFKKNFQYYADIASWIQRETERAVLYVVNTRYEMYPSDNLCYAGGVALNAVINSKIIDNTPVRNLFVQPAASDNGIALGCAFYGWMEVLKKERVLHDGSTCYGKIYNTATAKASLYQYHAPGPVTIKRNLDTFFSGIDKRYTNGNGGMSDILVQFNVKNAGTYQVMVDKEMIKSKNDIIGSPTSEVFIENTDLYYTLQDPGYFRTLLDTSRIRMTKNDEFLYLLGIMNSGQNGGSEQKKEYTNYLNYIHFEGEGYIKETARLLAEGNIIGWFQDASEFGPRALGRRSILSDPRKRGVRDFINAEIKRREDYRPFAPSVLREDVSVYFETDMDAPYMLTVSKIKKQWKEILAEIVHVDGTCRVQTVTSDWNPKYTCLLNEFKKQTGLSVLLNTSFNGRAMPIVETPADAIRFFYSCQLDYLVIQDMIIRKSFC